MTSLPRRSVLALGVAAVAGLALRSGRAQAAEVMVGDLAFAVPGSVRPAPATALLGEHWQWRGGTGETGTVPHGLVLARADLPTLEPAEVLGLLLAGTASGLLPDLRMTSQATRAMPGGGEQVRIALSYAIAPRIRYQGQLLIATRARVPGGLLVCLSDGSLPISFVDGVLESARWRA